MFFFALFIPVFFAFSSPQNNRIDGGCPPPANVALSAQSGSSVTFDWDDCTCGGIYHVYFVRSGQYSPVFATGATSITLSGLAAGTYQFHFYTVYGGEASAIIVEEIIIL